MNEAVENTPEIYKDISTVDQMPSTRKNTSQINKHLIHLYEILKR